MVRASHGRDRHESRGNPPSFQSLDDDVHHIDDRKRRECVLQPWQKAIAEFAVVQAHDIGLPAFDEVGEKGRVRAERQEAMQHEDIARQSVELPLPRILGAPGGHHGDFPIEALRQLGEQIEVDTVGPAQIRGAERSAAPSGASSAAGWQELPRRQIPLRVAPRLESSGIRRYKVWDSARESAAPTPRASGQSADWENVSGVLRCTGTSSAAL